MEKEIFNEASELAWLLEELTKIIESDSKTASRSIKQVKNVVSLAKAGLAGGI